MTLKSQTQLASEYCMVAAGQKVRQRPATPTSAERLLRARLIMEETLETIEALGCKAFDCTGSVVTAKNGGFTLAAGPDELFNLTESIDGCCDLNVVVAGTMSCIGVPDGPFQDVVNQANAAKFPNGVAVPHSTVPGKYGKPDDWQPPNHSAVLAQLALDALEDASL